MTPADSEIRIAHGASLLEIRQRLILEELSRTYEGVGNCQVCLALLLTYCEWPTEGDVAQELAALGVRQAADESERKAAAGNEGWTDDE